MQLTCARCQAIILVETVNSLWDGIRCPNCQTEYRLMDASQPTHIGLHVGHNNHIVNSPMQIEGIGSVAIRETTISLRSPESDETSS
jgi:DNA-directed RNA polymerase subunit RPC12/RpoP